MVEVFELPMCFFAKNSWLGIGPVVPEAIAEYKYYIIQKGLNFEVLVPFGLLFYRWEVHWFLNYLEIVWDLQLFGVNWLVEDPGGRHFWHACYHSRGSFLPMIKNIAILLIVFCLRHLYRVYIRLIKEVLRKLRMIHGEFLEFILRNWPKLIAVLDSQGELLQFFEFILFDNWCLLLLTSLRLNDGFFNYATAILFVGFVFAAVGGGWSSMFEQQFFHRRLTRSLSITNQI